MLLKNKNTANKVMDMAEAVERFVPSGCSLGIANFLSSGPYAILHEIVRQEKRDLTVYSTSTMCEQDLLVAGGCVSRIATAYSHRFSVARNGTAIERAVRKGELEYEEFSNYAIAQMFQAGAMGLSFMPMLPAIGTTDVFNKRAWMGDNKMKWIDCPFTGKKYVAVPALNPDVAVVHAQRADKYGNLQYWGTKSTVRDICLSATKHVVASVEEVVEPEVIRQSPHSTILPGFRVDAVVECPWGAHPTELLGYYGLDYGFLAQFFLDQMSKFAMKKWMKKWIYSLPNREAYLEEIVNEYGQATLHRLKARHLPSATIDYGSPMRNMWCEEGGTFSPWIGLYKDEYVAFMKEKLEMYEMDESNVPAGRDGQE